MDVKSVWASGCWSYWSSRKEFLPSHWQAEVLWVLWVFRLGSEINWDVPREDPWWQHACRFSQLGKISFQEIEKAYSLRASRPVTCTPTVALDLRGMLVCWELGQHWLGLTVEATPGFGKSTGSNGGRERELEPRKQALPTTSVLSLPPHTAAHGEPATSCGDLFVNN